MRPLRLSTPPLTPNTNALDGLLVVKIVPEVVPVPVGVNRTSPPLIVIVPPLPYWLAPAAGMGMLALVPTAANSTSPELTTNPPLQELAALVIRQVPPLATI